MAMAVEYSRKFHFGFRQEYSSQDDAMRMAEWKEKCMREYRGEQYISSRIIRKPDYVQVELHYKEAAPIW